MWLANVNVSSAEQACILGLMTSTLLDRQAGIQGVNLVKVLETWDEIIY